MRYVIIRDDDTNALTPVECLERLYRPFLEKGFPVNLATIPDVSTDARMADGSLEGFLLHKNGEKERSRAIGSNRDLVNYLKENPGYRIVQHGLHHDYLEFDSPSGDEMGRRLDSGTRLLVEAGFPRPRTFVAPYDKLSTASLREVSKRFDVLSTGWFEMKRLPRVWWPKYALKKLTKAPHWKVGRTFMLSHPGCLLSCHRDYSTMLQSIVQQLNSGNLTVLVTHWWEYFRNNRPDEQFISFLHQTAGYIASRSDLRVIAFDDLPSTKVQLN